MLAMNLHIRLLDAGDIQPIADAFQTLGWNKPASRYERYLSEQQSGDRVVFVAFENNIFAGYVTLNWLAEYPPFRDKNIPEIRDFNVLPQFRRRGIGTRLMEAAEQTVAQRLPVVGLGVGLDPDYGAAQRLYVRQGYIPDGRGLYTNGVWVKWGTQVTVDENLALYFTKQLR